MSQDRHRVLSAPRIIAGIVVLIALLVVAVVATAAVKLPGCDSCHKDADFKTETAATAHAAVPCVDCHVATQVIERIQYGAHVVSLPIQSLLRSDSRALGAVDDGSCLSCHEDVMTSTVQARGLRIDHKVCAVDAACTDCHSTTAHGDQVSWKRASNMDACLRCHGQQGKLVECDTCHVARESGDRLKSGPWVVTHGPNWKTTHGMGDAYTCAACHQSGYCDRCHGVGLPHDANLMEQHPALAADPGARCTSCHEAKFCDTCHGIEMPHPANFKQGHSTLVEAEGDDMCRTCHGASDCVECHVMHIHPGGANASSGGR